MIGFFVPKRSETIRLGTAGIVVSLVENILAGAVQNKLLKGAVAEIEYIAACHLQKLLQSEFFVVRKVGHYDSARGATPRP